MSLYRAASAAAAYSVPEQEFYALPTATSPPTKQQLADLKALPTALYQKGITAINHRTTTTNRSARGNAAGNRKSRGMKQKVGRERGRNNSGRAREGQIVSRSYDVFGARPQPTNDLRLTQQITLELSLPSGVFITSVATLGLPSFAARSFQISDYSGAAQALSFFDQYRIDQVEVWLDFNAPNGTAPMPSLATCVDLDDANVPTTVGQVSDHLGSIVAQGPSGHYHKWKPHIAVATFSGTFTSYANAPASWIDSASPNVQHYGLKAATVSGGAAFAVTLQSRVVVTFRAPGIN